MQDDISSRLKEQKFQKNIEYLLDHLVVFLFGSKHVLQQLNEVRRCYDVGNLVVSAKSTDKHETFKNDVVFRKAVDQVIVNEFDHVSLLCDCCPVL